MAEKHIEFEDSEIRFLSTAMENYKYWKLKAHTLQQDGRDNALELKFAEAFKIQLNAFTEDEQPSQVQK